MRLLLAIVLGLLLGGALAWWLDRPPREATPAAAPADTTRATTGTRPPTLYRWRDDAGVLQVTDRPPQGRPYEIVDIPDDRNVVPLTPPADRD